MTEQASLPLFVLPMVLMPGEVQELRVFEPRYRQMLDDCLLDNKNFCLAAMGSWTIPVVAWFEGIIHHKSEIFVVK